MKQEQKGIFSDFFFLCTKFNTASSEFTVSEDVGIDPRAVATTALAVGRSNHPARSHPQTRLDLIYVDGPRTVLSLEWD